MASAKGLVNLEMLSTGDMNRNMTMRNGSTLT
jgi:hypothetical protein